MFYTVIAIWLNSTMLGTQVCAPVRTGSVSVHVSVASHVGKVTMLVCVTAWGGSEKLLFMFFSQDG